MTPAERQTLAQALAEATAAEQQRDLALALAQRLQRAQAVLPGGEFINLVMALPPLADGLPWSVIAQAVRALDARLQAAALPEQQAGNGLHAAALAAGADGEG